MYPQQELDRLAAHKATLRRDIMLRRAQCVEAATRVARPLDWVDRFVKVWRGLSAAVAHPAPDDARSTGPAPRNMILRTIMRWGPIVIGAARVVRRATKSKAGFADPGR